MKDCTDIVSITVWVCKKIKGYYHMILWFREKQKKIFYDYLLKLNSLTNKLTKCCSILNLVFRLLKIKKSYGILKDF